MPDSGVGLTCKKCQKPFPKSRGGVKKFCSPECRLTHWVSHNRDKLNKTVREYRKRRYERDGCWLDKSPKSAALKAWMIELKSKPCTDCGDCFPVCCMDFDHRKGEKKEYNVGSMFAHHYAREKIEREIAKCDLVCSNCHRVRTRDRKTGTRRTKT